MRGLKIYRQIGKRAEFFTFCKGLYLHCIHLKINYVTMAHMAFKKPKGVNKVWEPEILKKKHLRLYIPRLV
jgi:hypothetical protein